MKKHIQILLTGILLSTGLFAQDYALDFDGSNDYVNCGSAAGLDIGDPITLQVWFYLDDKNSAHLVQKGSLGDGYTLRIDSNDNGVTAIYGASIGNTWKLSGASAEISGWHHYVVTDDGTNLKIYYDGSSIATGTSSRDIDYDGNFVIGANSSGSGNNVNGKIDEVAIWNDALDADAVTALYNSGSGIDASSNSGNYDEYTDNLQGYWKFNEGSGSTTEDVSGNINTGTLGTSTQGDDAEPSWVASGLSLPTIVQPTIGDGSSGSPYQIAILANLNWITQDNSRWDKHYIQTADIDASATSTWDSGAGFTPIGGNGSSTPYFSGVYNGQNYTISGLVINRPTVDYIGLFGAANGATIQNLGVIGGSVSGDKAVGALVGRTDNTTVQNCYATANVTSSSGSEQDYIGGLIGYNTSNVYESYYASGTITGGDYYTGGLIGYNISGSSVRNSYSTGTVVGTNMAGGLIGRNAGGIIDNSYSTGSVSGNSDVGGLLGYNSGTVNNSFWDTQTSGQASSAGGTGKTTAQMKTQSTFTDAGWDFEIETTNGTNNYWDIDGTNSINNGYPFLSWQNGEDVSLPVELTSFTADNSRAGEITLHWVTESEIENLGFILERGAESEDGTTAEWTEIASYITDESLRGQGSVTYRTEYSFTDKTVEPGVTYDYRLADVSYAGEKVYHALNVLGVAVTEIPEEFALFPAYPNPFNPETVIRYQLSADSDVSLQIYDLKGQMIETLLNKTQDPGFYKVNWKPNNLPSGVYFCKLTIGDRVSTQKLILLK